MISNAPAGFKTLSLGDQFAAARGDLAGPSVFETGFDSINPATFQNPLSVAPAQAIDPMEWFSGPAARNDGPADPAKALQDRLQAATHKTSGIWKAADAVRPDKVIGGVETLARSHSEQTKGLTADSMKTAQIAEIKAILKDMTAAGIGPVAQAPGQSPGGGLAGNFARDTLLTTGLTSLLGPVGAVVATGVMAARAGLEGQGTLVTFNKTPGYFGAALSSGRHRGRESAPVDYGYSPAPSVTQQTSAPVSNSFQQGMSKGPGFGRADILADSKMPKQTFDDMAIKIAGDSPAGKAIEDMRVNSRQTTTALRAQRDGVDATLDNLNRTMELGMEPPVTQGPKIPTFHMT